MDPYIIGIAAVVVLMLVSTGANRRLADLTELPMQWGLRGKPTWGAPRRMALAFTPNIGAISLLAVASKTTASPGLTLVAAAAFISAHILHLALTFRTVCR